MNKTINLDDEVVVNGGGDLFMDGDVRPCIGKVVRVVGCTKGGLYRVRLPDGRTFSIPKRNLDPVCKCYEHCEDDDSGVERRPGCLKRL